MNSPAQPAHIGFYSETYSSVMIGELILIAFEVLLLSIFKTKHLHSRESTQSDPWSSANNMKSQTTLKSADQFAQSNDPSVIFFSEAQMPLPITNLSNLFIAHVIVVATALSTPAHSVLLVILTWVHGGFYSATVLLIVHEKRLAYIFVLICFAFDIAILGVCLAEKVEQLPLYEIAQNFFSRY
jgi:hypothetical protein